MKRAPGSRMGRTVELCGSLPWLGYNIFLALGPVPTRNLVDDGDREFKRSFPSRRLASVGFVVSPHSLTM